MKFFNILFCFTLISSISEARVPGSKIKTNMANIQTKKTSFPENSVYNLDSQWLDQNGSTKSLSDFEGKAVVISMVYLSCAYSCPLTIAQMKEVEKLLTGPSKETTQFVLVSFDTVKDTPDLLKAYAQKNQLKFPQWTFLMTKKEGHVRELSSIIDFKYKKLESGEFEHSYAIILLDSKGVIKGRTEGSEMNPKALADLINSNFDLKSGAH